MDEDRTVGVSVTLGSTFFNGACDACEEPERGGVVTVVAALTSGKTLVLCPGHHANLLTNLGKVRPVGGAVVALVYTLPCEVDAVRAAATSDRRSR